LIPGSAQQGRERVSTSRSNRNATRIVMHSQNWLVSTLEVSGDTNDRAVALWLETVFETSCTYTTE
jgi:hypothetical protein